MHIQTQSQKTLSKLVSKRLLAAIAVVAVTVGAIVPVSAARATSINLVVNSFALTDSNGVVKTTFAPNEPIFVKTTLDNTGTTSSPSGIKTEFYANRPAAVANGTVDSPEFAIQHGYFPRSSSYSYGSYSSDPRSDQFIGATRSMSQSTPGTYTARVFVDATDLAVETSSTDNQKTVTYTISDSATPPPAPVPAPTVATSKIDLAVDSFQLTDVNGTVKTSFNTFEPIFVKMTLHNKGTVQSSSGIRTEVYANMPSTAAVGAKDVPEFGIVHGSFSRASVYTYASRPNGDRESQFIGSPRTFYQPAAGTYTARAFVDAMNLDGEPDETNNQYALTYTVTAAPWPQPVADPMAYDMIVNKKHILSSMFVPSDLVYPNVPNPNNHMLRQGAAIALEQMAAAASSQGITLRLMSGYRSYWTQYDLYWGYVATDGQALTDTYSARPGYSEHQTGLTLDIGDGKATGCDIEDCFATTAGGQWVAAHAHEYGYIIRYETGKEAITGYKAEPWHIRYVGVPLATTLKNSGMTMEEYFGVPGGDYQ